MSNNNKSRIPPHLPIYIISLLLIVLTSCILSPIYMQVGNDIVFMYTVLPIILNYAILLFETMYLALIFAGVAYSAYAINKGTEKKIPNIIYPLSLVFIKHVLNLLVSSIIDSYIDVMFDLPVTIMLMFVDALIIAVVCIIANRKTKLHFARVKKIMKAAKYLDTADYDDSLDIFPFRGFFDLKNPIIISIISGAIITTVSMILQRLYADIFVLGAPVNFFEIAEMFIAYLADILLGLAGYATSYLAATYIFLRVENKNEN